MKNRLIQVDITKAMCLLWIIAAWHIREYCEAFPISNSAFQNFITTAVLGAFTFCSGLLTAVSAEKSETLAGFLKKRILKIYPQFFLSVLCLYILSVTLGKGYVKSVSQMLLTLTGLSAFFPPMASTVWYMSMMLLFWAITPLINKKNPIKLSLFSLLIWIALFVLYRCVGIERRMLFMFPTYCAGLLFWNTLRAKLPKWSLAVLLLVSAAVFVLTWKLFTVERVSDTVATLVNTCSGAAALYACFSLISEFCGNGLRTVFRFLNDVSMSAYLFHRVVYSLLMLVIGSFTMAEAYLLAVPLCLLVSYGINRCNDLVIKCLTKTGETC